MGGTTFYQAFMSGFNPHLEKREASRNDWRNARVKSIDDFIASNPNLTANEIMELTDEKATLYNDKYVKKMIKEAGQRYADFRAKLSQTPLQRPATTSPIAPSTDSGSAQLKQPSMTPMPDLQPRPQLSAQPGPEIQNAIPSARPFTGTIYEKSSTAPTFSSQPNAAQLPSMAPISDAAPKVPTQPQAPELTPIRTSTPLPSYPYPASASGLERMMAEQNRTPADAFVETVNKLRSAYPNEDMRTIMNIAAGRNVASTTMQKPQALKSWIGKDGKVHQLLLFPGEEQPREIVSEGEAQEPYRRPIYSGEISVAQAIKAAKDYGAEFKDKDGNPIPTSQMDPNLKLRMFQIGSNPPYYVVGEQRQTTRTAGGELYGMSEYDIKNTLDWVDLGAGQVTRTTSSETPVMVNGELRFIPRISETVPRLTGAVGGSSPTDLTPPSMRERKLPEGATPVYDGEENDLTPPSMRTAPAKPTPAPATLSTGGRSVPGLQPTQHRMWVQMAVPVREASTQLFGSPDHPEFKGLEQYASIADDPVAAKAVANAINISMNHLETLENRHGGLINLISYKMGVPQSLSRAYVEAMREVAAKPLQGHPEWQDAYDSAIAAFAVIMGMRAATRAPASEFTSKSLEREVPIAGLFVGNSRQFYNKLAKIALEVDNVAKQIPNEAMGADERSHIKNKVDEMLQKAKPSPTGMGKPPSQRKSLDEIFGGG